MQSKVIVIIDRNNKTQLANFWGATGPGLVLAIDFERKLSYIY